MSQPDTNEFARQVLLHLASNSAQIEELKLLVCDVLAEVTSLPVEQIQDRYTKAAVQRASQLYEESLQAAKIADPDVPGENPLYPGRGANPIG